MTAAGKKDDNLRLVQSLLADGQMDGSTTPEPATNLALEVDRAFAQYEAIESALREITVEEMRARFAQLSGLPKPVLGGVLAKLGYPASGTKDEIEAQLLDNLTSLKISYEQRKQIGS
jgi:hypothetical protein